MPELITEETVSVESIRKILDAAYIEYSMTDNGDIRVRDRISVIVHPNKDQRTIKLYAVFGFKTSSTMAQRLEAVNKMNAEYIVIRASVAGDTLWFEHELMLDGGLTPKNLILSMKRFAGIPMAAISEHAKDMVE